MNFSGVIPRGGRWLLRKLCTAAKKLASSEGSGNDLGLYRRLSPLGLTGGTVSETLNQYIMEGKAIRKDELGICIKHLRKYLKFKHALEIMEWMELKKIRYHSGDFAMRLDLIHKTRGMVAAENYFNALPSQAENKFTYEVLLNCYCKEIMVDKALALFNKMDDLGYVDNLAFNYLMSLYMRLGQPEKVAPLVHDLKQRKIPMSAFTYHIWMNSYASLNDIGGVERVYEEMRKEEIEEISWRTYSNLAAIYVRTRHFDKAKLALKMLEKNVKPRQREANHFLLSLYAGICDPGQVYRVWNSIKSVPPVTNKSYLIMLQALCKLNDINGLTKCFEEWKSKCISYDIRLASTVISAYLSQDLFEEATLVFEEAINRSKGPFFGIREMFMNFFLKHHQVDVARSHLEAAISEVKDDEWRPSPALASAFLKYYEQEKDVDGVEELCKILEIPNSETHQTLKEDFEVNHEFDELHGELFSNRLTMQNSPICRIWVNSF